MEKPRLQLLVDTREKDVLLQNNLIKLCTLSVKYDIAVVKEKLNVGDYAIRYANLDTGEFIIVPQIIEKKTLTEFIGNITSSDRERVKREIQRAIEHGIKLHFLISTNGTDFLESIFQHHYSSKAHPNSIIMTLIKWSAVYGITFTPCHYDYMANYILYFLVGSYEVYNKTNQYQIL